MSSAITLFASLYLAALNSSEVGDAFDIVHCYYQQDHTGTTTYVADLEQSTPYLLGWFSGNRADTALRNLVIAGFQIVDLFTLYQDPTYEEQTVRKRAVYEHQDD